MDEETPFTTDEKIRHLGINVARHRQNLWGKVSNIKRSRWTPKQTEELFLDRK